jgi:hypothetical protein
LGAFSQKVSSEPIGRFDSTDETHSNPRIVIGRPRI